MMTEDLVSDRAFMKIKIGWRQHARRHGREEVGACVRMVADATGRSCVILRERSIKGRRTQLLSRNSVHEDPWRCYCKYAIPNSAVVSCVGRMVGRRGVGRGARRRRSAARGCALSLSDFCKQV